jgi:hypothetical protein
MEGPQYALSLVVQHPQLWLTSEERVLDAVLLWGAHTGGLATWQDVDTAVHEIGANTVFRERRDEVEKLLGLVHFPIMMPSVLQRVRGPAAHPTAGLCPGTTALCSGTSALCRLSELRAQGLLAGAPLVPVLVCSLFEHLSSWDPVLLRSVLC